MIYCNLKGGLGNIIIQIAATKSFAIDKGVDCSFPNLESQLNLINDEMLSNPKVKHAFEYLIMFEHLNTSAPNKAIPVINFPFEYADIQIPDTDCYINGFFQSEKYFKHNRELLLDFFKIPDIINNKIIKKYSDILNVRTTSIHIRRGDYVNRYPNHHPTPTLQYFRESANELKSYTDLFIIFSDDIDWCKENLNIDNSVYIEKERDYIEIYLMSLCNNNIISNSSFSWWGAWLNNNEDKKVIGPKIWFGPEISFVSSDIIPEAWIKK